MSVYGPPFELEWESRCGLTYVFGWRPDLDSELQSARPCALRWATWSSLLQAGRIRGLKRRHKRCGERRRDEDPGSVCFHPPRRLPPNMIRLLLKVIIVN